MNHPRDTGIQNSGLKRGKCGVGNGRQTCLHCLEGLKACTKRMCIDIELVNDYSQTKLHLLCNDSLCSVEEVRQEIDHSPIALGWKDAFGRTPLFYALKRSCSFEVFQVLFDKFQDAIVCKDFCGDSPLQLLYHSNADPTMLKCALSKMPSLAVHMENSFSGQALFKRVSAPWTVVRSKSIRSEIEANAILRDRWTKFVLTARSAHAYSLGQNTINFEIPELHLALDFRCHPSLLSHFIEMYPDQVGMKMKDSSWYPLHYFLHHCKESCGTREVVRGMIRSFPSAVSLPAVEDKLPIHLALLSGMKWIAGVQDIVFAAPECLEVVDPATRLLPFMQAAMCTESDDLTTAFCLLRENPAILTNL